MKLALLHDSFSTRGGAEIYVEKLLEGLSSRGHEVVLVAGDVSRARWQGPAAAITRVSPVLSGSRPRGIWERIGWHGKELFREKRDDGHPRVVLRSLKPDVVHSHNISGIGWRALGSASSGIKWVHTVHDFALIDPTRTMAHSDGRQRTRLGVARRLRARRVARFFRPDCLVFPSQRIADLHDRFGYAGAPREIIPHGWYDFSIDSAGPPKAANAQALYMGALSTHKGVDFLLELWLRNPRLPRLVLAGRGPLEPDVRAAATANPERVTYAGWVDGGRKAHLIRASSVILMPSRWPEVFPIVVMEAILAHRPVLASEVAAPPLVIHGQSGELRDLKFEAWSRAVRRMVREPSRYDRGLGFVRRALDWETHLDRLERVYERVSQA